MAAFQAKRFEYSCIVPVAAKPDEVFPLLCPTREYEWIDGWNCELVYSKSGLIEEDCTFVTDMPDEGMTVWVTSVHDPRVRRVEFVRFTPAVRVLKMQVRVDEAAAGNSELQFHYTVTALSEKGNEQIDQFVVTQGGALAARAKHLGGLLSHFLTTGSMLRKADYGT